MRKHTRLWITAVSCVGMSACGPQRESNHPNSNSALGDQARTEHEGREHDTVAARGAEPASPTEPRGQAKLQPASEERPESARDTKSALPESQVPSPESQPAKDSASQGLAEICEKLTRRANQRCTKQVASLYQSTCNHYLKKPGECPDQIRLALECQYQASDESLCAHEADQKCLKLNRELKQCQRGVAVPEQTTAEDLTLPSDWERVRDDQLGFSVALPPGATLDTSGKHRTWKAEEGGVSYIVAAIDPPSGKLTNQLWVRTVIGYVGTRCQQRLRLHGELDLKGTTVVQYHSACPDKTEWHGMLHLWKGKAVSTGYHAPAGVQGVQEPFFYSFQVAE